MGANKGKQNIRMKRVCERVANKTTYKGLTEQEVKYVKTVRQHQQIEKDLNYFYATCKRTETGQVDWDSMDDKELDYFDYIYKLSERLYKRKSNMEEKFDGDKVMKSFLQINNRSISF
jgi:hypothetical protein